MTSTRVCPWSWHATAAHLQKLFFGEEELPPAEEETELSELPAALPGGAPESLQTVLPVVENNELTAFEEEAAAPTPHSEPPTTPPKSQDSVCPGFYRDGPSVTVLVQ